MKSKTGKIILCAVLAVILGIVVFVGCTASEMLNKINRVEVTDVKESEPAVETEAPVTEPAATEAAEESTEETEETEETTEATEEAAAYEDPDATHYLVVCKPIWSDGNQVTKNMFLCSLNEKTKVITMTALQPDAEITLPKYKTISGGEKAALKTVYGMGSKFGTAGSMELLNQTLYDNYGIKVDENLEFDMQVFSRVVRRIDGVEIELSEEEAKYLTEKTGREIKAGVQKMDGYLAESYVEMWGADAEGVSVLSSQKKLVEAIVKAVSTRNVNNLKTIVMEILPSITTSMSRKEIEEVLFTLLPMLRDLSIASGGVYPAA